MAEHIEYLTLMEERMSSLMWGRTGEDRIWVSVVGYIPWQISELEEGLLKRGCRYDFKKGVQQFDRVSGRTTTHFEEA